MGVRLHERSELYSVAFDRFHMQEPNAKVLAIEIQGDGYFKVWAERNGERFWWKAQVLDMIREHASSIAGFWERQSGDNVVNLRRGETIGDAIFRTPEGGEWRDARDRARDDAITRFSGRDGLSATVTQRGREYIQTYDGPVVAGVNRHKFGWATQDASEPVAEMIDSRRAYTQQMAAKTETRNQKEYAMEHIQRELDQIREAMLSAPDSPDYDRLYAAQQALSWATDPDGFKSPMAMIAGKVGVTSGSHDYPPQP